jgi:hypothetical protein
MESFREHNHEDKLSLTGATDRPTAFTKEASDSSCLNEDLQKLNMYVRMYLYVYLCLYS